MLWWTILACTTNPEAPPGFLDPCAASEDCEGDLLCFELDADGGGRCTYVCESGDDCPVEDPYCDGAQQVDGIFDSACGG